jgi:hypothetical protein
MTILDVTEHVVISGNHVKGTTTDIRIKDCPLPSSDCLQVFLLVLFFKGLDVPEQFIANGLYFREKLNNLQRV